MKRFPLPRLLHLFTAFLAVMALSLFSAQAITTASAATKDGDHHKKNIVEIASSNDSFTTLTAAVTAAGLADVLQSDGPFTVFAPTDEAFAKLPAGTLEMLLKPENKDKLVAILTYHVVAGEVTAAQVVKLDEAETVQGAAVTITTSDHGVMINNANVLKTDIQATNGVIHVIDTVLLPPMGH